jgi:hypothetical protein
MQFAKFPDFAIARRKTRVNALMAQSGLHVALIYRAVRFALLATSAHLAVSFLRKLASSSGEPPIK